MSNPILENLADRPQPELPTQTGPQGAGAANAPPPGGGLGVTPRPPTPLPIDVPSSQLLQSQLEDVEIRAGEGLNDPTPEVGANPQFTGPDSAQTGNALQDPDYLAQQARDAFQERLDWMEARKAYDTSMVNLPVFADDLAGMNLPHMQELPTSGIINPGDLGALVTKREQARSSANTGVYYGPAGGPNGSGGVQLPDNMERYGPDIDGAIRANRARASTPNPTTGVANNNVRGVLGLFGLAGRAALGVQRGGARAVQQLTTGQTTAPLTRLDWVKGAVAGGVGLINQEGRKAWRAGFAEAWTGLGANEREALTQLTPTTQSGRRGFGDYGSGALGAVNYGLDSIGNQLRGQLAARKELGIAPIGIPNNAATRRKLADLARRKAAEAARGREFSFLNPDSPLTLFNKNEKNPTWWKTTARTVANVALDTVTGGPDVTDLVGAGRKYITRNLTGRATRVAPRAVAALPPGKTGGALARVAKPIEVIPTPVRMGPPVRPVRALPTPWPDAVIDVDFTVTRNAPTVEPLIPDPWKDPIPVPPRSNAIVPSPKGGVVVAPKKTPGAIVPNPAGKLSTWGGMMALPRPDRGPSARVPVPDPWRTPQAVTITTGSAPAPKPYDLDRLIAPEVSAPVLALPPASTLGDIDPTPDLPRPRPPEAARVPGTTLEPTPNPPTGADAWTGPELFDDPDTPEPNPELLRPIEPDDIATPGDAARANEERARALQAHIDQRTDQPPQPLVEAVRAAPPGVPLAAIDPAAPQKVLTHATATGTLHPVQGGGLVSTTQAIKAAQYKLVDLRLRQQATRAKADAAPNSILREQLRERAAQMQEVIDDLRLTITGRPLRKGFADALTEEEIDRVLPVIPQAVMNPTPAQGPDFVNRVRATPPPLVTRIAGESRRTVVSRTAEELSALARGLGHTTEGGTLGWDALADLNRKHGLYGVRGAPIPTEALNQAVTTGMGRVEVIAPTDGVPQVTKIVRRTPRTLDSTYDKAVQTLGREFPDALPSQDAWGALARRAAVDDDTYLALVDTWVTSDGRGPLRRAMNPIMTRFPPSATNYAALVAHYGPRTAKEKARLPKALQTLLKGPYSPPEARPAVGLFDADGGRVAAVESAVPDATPREAEALARAAEGDALVQAKVLARQRATDAREALVELEAQQVNLTAQSAISRDELQALPAIEPRSLLDGTFENGTAQDVVREVFASLVDTAPPRVEVPGWGRPATANDPVLLHNGQWHRDIGLPSRTAPSRGNVPPGWKLLSVEPEVATAAAQARVAANTIWDDVAYQPTTRRVDVPDNARIVGLDDTVPTPLRAALGHRVWQTIGGAAGERLAKALGGGGDMSLRDVLRLFETDHITHAPTVPISEIDGARYNAALFRELGGSLELIDLGGGNYLAPHHLLGSAWNNSAVRGFRVVADPTPSQAALARLAIDGLFARPDGDVVDATLRALNTDQHIQEQLDELTDLVDEAQARLDTALVDLEGADDQAEAFFREQQAQAQARKADAQRTTLDNDHATIDEHAPPNCL